MDTLTRYVANDDDSLAHASSVIRLMGLLSVTRDYPHDIPLEYQLQYQADITANRIIMHAEFALDELGGAQ